MSNAPKSPDRMIVTLNLAELEQIVEAAVVRALNKKQPVKLQYTLEEAAQRLNVKPSLLGAKVRSGELPHHRTGRRIFFTQADIEAIDQMTAVSPKNDNGTV
jgi:excisionase family DNA binding protein